VAEQGAGTGFVVTVDEVIAVNDHVVSGAQTIAVPLAGGRTLPARVRGAGPAAVSEEDPAASRQQESLLWAGCHRGWRLVAMTGITCAFILRRRPWVEEDVSGW
jgi:hypothetical protein